MKNVIAKLIGLYLNTLAYVSPRKAANAAFLIFCRPYRLKFNQKQIDFFNTAEKFSMEVDDVNIQGYRWGKGDKKILFLHGWESHSYRWKSYIEALPQDEFTVYAIDAPGHGSSSGNFLSVPLYSSVIQQFIVNEGNVHTVVSHSLGSFSLLYTLHRYPLLRVGRLILMAPPGEANDFLSVFKNTLGASERLMDLLNSYFQHRYDVTPDYFSAAKFAASVQIEGLLIHDEKDTEAPYHYSRAINKVWKRSRLVTTHGLGHNLRSLTVVEEVVSFITGTVQDIRQHEQLATSEFR